MRRASDVYAAPFWLVRSFNERRCAAPPNYCAGSVAPRPRIGARRVGTEVGQEGVDPRGKPTRRSHPRPPVWVRRCACVAFVGRPTRRRPEARHPPPDPGPKQTPGAAALRRLHDTDNAFSGGRPTGTAASVGPDRATPPGLPSPPGLGDKQAETHQCDSMCFSLRLIVQGYDQLLHYRLRHLLLVPGMALQRTLILSTLGLDVSLSHAAVPILITDGSWDVPEQNQN